MSGLNAFLCEVAFALCVLSKAADGGLSSEGMLTDPCERFIALPAGMVRRLVVCEWHLIRLCGRKRSLKGLATGLARDRQL